MRRRGGAREVTRHLPLFLSVPVNLEILNKAGFFLYLGVD